MTPSDVLKGPQLQRKFAVGLFNLTWDLLEKENRTLADDERMLYATHASRFHWGEIGTPLECARGEWQISRVYATLHRSTAALHHAQRCLDLCLDHQIGDFDLAFAYEALARAHAVAQDVAQSRRFIQLAEQAAEQIAKEGDRQHFLSELATVSRLLTP